MLDDKNTALKTALYEIALTDKVNFRFTSNQNLILSDIKPDDKNSINQLLDKYLILSQTEQTSIIRKNSIACVALNTCPLALAEGQRYMPYLISKIEPIINKYGLEKESMIVRMTGCPNGCARPFAAEIGFVGTSYGLYNLYLGGDRFGLRLNKLYKENLNEESILKELDRWFSLFKSKGQKEETFGDFSNRYMSEEINFN